MTEKKTKAAQEVLDLDDDSTSKAPKKTKSKKSSAKKTTSKAASSKKASTKKGASKKNVDDAGVDDEVAASDAAAAGDAAAASNAATASDAGSASDEATADDAAKSAKASKSATSGSEKITVRKTRKKKSEKSQVDDEASSIDEKNTERSKDDAAQDKDNNEHANGDSSTEDEHTASAEESDSSISGGRRRARRGRRNGPSVRREVAPSATRDELANLADDELIAKALLLDVDPTEYGERDDLVSAVYDSLLQAEGFVMVEGILDILPDGYGFIRTDGYLPGDHDVYVGASMVRRNGLRKGDYINGRVRPPRDNEKYPALNMIVLLNGEPFEGPTRRVKFANLTPIYPDERLMMEHGASTITARAIDLVAPIGKGQRGLIVSPPKAGKTTVLKDIAAAISANDPDVHLMCLLVDERPEEVTDMERSIDGEVISSTFDMPCENHIAVAELVIERAKRLVETGQDVVILLDSITRLARAYNLGQPASGRILSGGVDSTALYPPKRFLGAARNIEGGGSLTILGTALIETGSKMDEVIFEEFKGTGNMELKLDRSLADRRIFPAIDPITSGTRKEELLLDPQEAPLIWGLRRLLANMNNPERAMDMLVKSLKQTDNNREFLVKSAKKAHKNTAVAEAF